MKPLIETLLNLILLLLRKIHLYIDKEDIAIAFPFGNDRGCVAALEEG